MGDLRMRLAFKNHLAVTLIALGFPFSTIFLAVNKKALESTHGVCISKAQHLFGISDQIGQ